MRNGCELKNGFAAGPLIRLPDCFTTVFHERIEFGTAGSLAQDDVEVTPQGDVSTANSIYETEGYIDIEAPGRYSLPTSS
jgi:hypothetical protein